MVVNSSSSSLTSLRERKAFRDYLVPLRQKEWVVYAKPPFAGPEQVLDYVGRYTHRVAISNNRLLDIDDGKVTFRWKDYRDGNIQKTMTLEAIVHPPLLYVLPPSYSASATTACSAIGIDKKARPLPTAATDDTENASGNASRSVPRLRERDEEFTGISLHQCPVYRQGRMLILEQLKRPDATPPTVDTS